MTSLQNTAGNAVKAAALPAPTFTRAQPGAFIPAESTGLGVTITATTTGTVLLKTHPAAPALHLSAAQALALAQELRHVAQAATSAAAEYQAIQGE